MKIINVIHVIEKLTYLRYLKDIAIIQHAFVSFFLNYKSSMYIGTSRTMAQIVETIIVL